MCGEIEKKENYNVSENEIADCEKLNYGENHIEASVALQVLPWVEMDKVNDIVDRVIEYIKSTGVRHVVGPFETTMEGDLDFLMEIVKKSQRIVIEAGAPEVISMVKIAFRPDSIGSATIDSKIGKYNQPKD